MTIREFTRAAARRVSEKKSANLTGMETWELLAKAIPRGEADRIGGMIGLSGQTVRSWRNDPNTDESKEGDPNGRRSPLDHFLQFLVAVHARSPEGAQLIVDYINAELAQMQAIHGREEVLLARQAANEARSLAQKIIAITDPVAGGEK